MCIPRGFPEDDWDRVEPQMEMLKWRQFDEISKDTISKIKYTALFQNLMKPSLKSSSAISDYVKVQQLDDIFQIRR
jgi:hypothetical protein